MWTLSNYAAGPKEIITELITDNTYEKIMDIASTIGNNLNEVFCESMFVITNLITTCNAE